MSEKDKSNKPQERPAPPPKPAPPPLRDIKEGHIPKKKD